MIIYPELGEYGRLGNQLFQLAATISLANHTNTEARIAVNLNDKEWHGQKCLLHNFKLDLKTYSSIDYNSFNRYDETSEVDIVNKIIKFNSLPSNTLLFGHFESEEYFKKYKKIICKHYEMNDDVEFYANNYLRELKQRVNKKEIVSIHFRMGDNLIKEGGKLMWFRSLISEIMKLYFSEDHYHFLIFTGGTREAGNSHTEDLNFVKTLFRDESKFSFCSENDTIKEFTLMKNSEHLILNWKSTFTWWAGYLNKNPSKKIVVPRTIPTLTYDADFFWSKEFIQYDKPLE